MASLDPHRTEEASEPLREDRRQRPSVFDRHPDQYDAWYTEHAVAYESELQAVRACLPRQGRGLEIGVGTGRFAAVLGIQYGLDPSRPMLIHAARRGVRGVQANGEAMPFVAEAFDYALLTTTLCFARDIPALLTETRRVLRPGGALVIGMVDGSATIAPTYLERHATGVFFREATPCTAAACERMLAEAGFRDMVWTQTITALPEEMRDIEPPMPGHGAGLFAVVRAVAA